MLNKTNLTHRQAAAMLILMALLWSTGGFLIKLVQWHPLAIAGARSGIAALVALVFLRRPRFTFSTYQIAAALAYTAHVTLFVLATKLTTAANAILLQYGAPIYIAVFAFWFLGERTTFRDWIYIGAVLSGMGLFFFDRVSTAGLWGNLMAIGSGLGYASLVLLVRKQKNVGLLEPVILGNLITVLIGLPFMFAQVPSPPAILGIFLLGTIQLGLPFVIFTIASRYVTALDLGLIPAVEPILNPIWVWLIVHEAPGPWALLGGSIVLLAITARSTMSRQRVSPCAPGDTPAVS